MKLQPHVITEFGNRYDASARSTIYMAIEIDDTEGRREEILELLNTPNAGDDASLYRFDW